MPQEKSDQKRTELTPNQDVPYFEVIAFNMGKMAYAESLRSLVIEKIDDPHHIWDDSVLAMFDGIFGYKKE